MASPSKPSKRKLDHSTPISPPPLRRKVQSTITQTAVASFFTPASQKPSEKVLWQERAPNDDIPNTLLVGKYVPSTEPSSALKDEGINTKRLKVAAFDFDSTLIQTSSGKKFASDAKDWKWWHSTVPSTLKKLYLEDGYRVVVISNQGGMSLKSDTKSPKSKLGSFKSKVSAVFTQLDIPISIYAATEKDIYRKPRTGIWSEFLEDYDLNVLGDLDLENSIFVGDAGGRNAREGKPKDFSCSDRNFAENVGIKFYTPEEYFLGEAPRAFTRSFEHSDYLPNPSNKLPEPFAKNNDLDIVLFCGSPAAGKSTFYWKVLEPLGYARINQDLLKTRDKCIKVAGDNLQQGKSVAIDNTNADVEVRSKWVELAAKYSVPIRCVLFTTGPELCEHNDVVRALNNAMNPEKRTVLPSMAFRGFASRYKRPELKEGFQDITEVAFRFNGSEEERQIWARHWT
ncbi:DNA kinase/phosphatase Pnk1 [Stipitochalara longipes BDJ]|nr:DNA kinase/phosphatase Pnk1 [Stipitochalara longipes BDJ]